MIFLEKKFQPPSAAHSIVEDLGARVIAAWLACHTLLQTLSRKHDIIVSTFTSPKNVLKE